MCFFFNAAATTEFYTCSHTLSLHDALPIYQFDQFSPVVFAEQGSYLDLSLHSAIASRSAAVRADDEISESLFCRERQLFEPFDFFDGLLRWSTLEVLEFLAIGILYTFVGIVRV